jgi:CBS domain-containing protein
VYFGASAEEAATIVHVRLGGRRVSDAMLFEPVTVAPTTSGDELRALLRHSAQRVFPIVGASGYEGIVDARAIEHSAPAQCAIALGERFSPGIAARDGLEDSLPLVLSAPARALAVIDRGRVVGLLRLEDVQHLVAEDTFRDQPQGPTARGVA